MANINFKIDGRAKRRLKNDKQNREMTWAEYVDFLQKREASRYDRKQQACKILESRYNKGIIDFNTYVRIKNAINAI